jgi:hypothetical protein
MHGKSYLLILSITAWVLLGACGDDDGGTTHDAAIGPDAATDPCESPDTLPPPTVEVTILVSTANTVFGFQQWQLIGNGLTPGSEELTFRVALPPGALCLDAWIDGEYVGRHTPEDAQGTLRLDISTLPNGDYELLLAAPGATEALAQRTFHRSHPYYVLVTNDWDDAIHNQNALDLQQLLHDNHPDMKMTHFVGPYTFTDPNVTPQEVDDTVAWVTAMRDTYDDEIGLHVHPYCHFVETTSVPCRWSPSFAYAEDPEGYTVVLGSYDQTEAEILFEQAKALFVAHGLGTPTSFRAGGWSAELHTLVALAVTGFTVDTSAANWSRMEEWEGQPGASLYEWNQSHWATIDEYSQPYYPSESDILSDTPPVVPILELPDNGLLVDYVTDEEIIEMFEAVWPGGALSEPRTYVTGYHPGSYWAFAGYLENGLTHIDQFLYVNDDGPVIYETVSNMALVWPLP